MSTKAVVLLSGGQDSTTALFWAKERFDDLYALSVDYGQRHAVELDRAELIARMAGAQWDCITLKALEEIGNSALVTGAAIQASGGEADEHNPDGLPTSFVPGRNMLFFGLAAAFAAKVGAKDIVTGVCETDFSGYPDCRRVFVDAMEQAATLALPSSRGPIAIHTPLMFIDKAATVKLARDLPGCWEALAFSVTCYEGQAPGCGECPACVLRARGFHEAGEVDPAQE